MTAWKRGQHKPASSHSETGAEAVRPVIWGLRPGDPPAERSQDAVCVCGGVRHAGAQAGLTHAPTPTRDSVLLLTLSELQTSSKTGMLHKVSRCYRD